MIDLHNERDVEAKFLQYIFCTILDYNTSHLHYDHPVTLHLGRETIIKKADLVVFIDNKPVIIVEAKNPDESIKNWINQADSYAFGLSVKYSVITNGRDLILRGYFDSNTKITLIDTSIKKLEDEKWQSIKNIINIDTIHDQKILELNELPPVDANEISNFRSFFKSLHNDIRDREKLDPAKCFDELSKILFLKIAELSNLQQNLTYQSIESFENISTEQADQYIQSIFSNTIKNIFPDIFDVNERIDLSPSTVKFILSRLEHFKLNDGKEDIKGRAFEEFLPTQLRGKGLGQFFTPRLIVNFMVNFANVSIYDVIVDFSCGSGGFLIKAYDKILEDIIKMPSELWLRLGISKEDFLSDIRKYKLNGIDAEPRAVRIAKMNMLLWGDGDRVVKGNGLDTKDSNGRDYFPAEYTQHKEIVQSGCTLILANPPFGSKESIEKSKKGESQNERLQREQRNVTSFNILSRYELGKNRNSQKTEILFLEKGLKLLRPQGRMLIVIPDSVLSSQNNAYVREFIMKHVEIKAVISLPNYTFVQSGVNTINTSILYIEKFTEEKKNKIDSLLRKNKYTDMVSFFNTHPEFSYEIFLAVADFIGFEPGGTLIKNIEETDLDLILSDYKNDRTNIEEINIIDFVNNIYLNRNYSTGSKGNKISRGVKNNSHISNIISVNELKNRIDPRYYFFRYCTSELMKNFVPLGNFIIQSARNIVKKETMNKDKDYDYISCTNEGLSILSEQLNYENISNQKYIVVQEGDIVYNPARLNIGSIGIVNKEMSGGLVSGAYEVFSVSEYINPELLIDILKTPLYRYYLFIISTGSVRDNVPLDLFSKILIPSIHAGEAQGIISELHKYKGEIERMKEKIKTHNAEIMEKVQKYLVH